MSSVLAVSSKQTSFMQIFNINPMLQKLRNFRDKMNNNMNQNESKMNTS